MGCTCSSSSLAHRLPGARAGHWELWRASRVVCWTQGVLGHWTSPAIRAKTPLCSHPLLWPRSSPVHQLPHHPAGIGKIRDFIPLDMTAKSSPSGIFFPPCWVEQGECTFKARPWKATATSGPDKSLWIGKVKVPLLTLDEEWTFLLRLLVQLHVPYFLWCNQVQLTAISCQQTSSHHTSTKFGPRAGEPASLYQQQLQQLF